MYNSYRIYHAVRPGYGEPKPLMPLNTQDPQEYIEKCLNCPIDGDCNKKSNRCPIKKKKVERIGNND